MSSSNPGPALTQDSRTRHSPTQGRLSRTGETAWNKPYVVKYKAPEPQEYKYFRKDLTLGAYFHAEDEDVLVHHMCEANMTAYSFEFFETPQGHLPMATADDEIAGKLAILYGAYLLQTHHGGSGVLLSHVPGAPQPKVLVIGYGDVGGAAARTAAALGCKVVVLGTSVVRLRKFESTVPPTVTCRINSPEVFEEEIRDADLVVGAILISTYDTEPMLERRHLKLMKPGSMIVDVTCGYGDGLGWMPTFHRQTTHDDPVYVVDGILHCKVDSLPAKVPATASPATSATMTPHLINLGNALFGGELDALAESGKIVANGEITHPYIRQHLDKKAQRSRGADLSSR